MEALRAHAVRSPDHTGPATPRVPPSSDRESERPPLSGHSSKSLRLPGAGRRFVPAWWILLLAVLFGLVAGVIVGVVSML